MSNLLVLTVMADDRPGIVEQVADVVSRYGGNWLESNMSHLAGKFTGILLVQIPGERQKEFSEALARLADVGIRVNAEPCQGGMESDEGTLLLTVVGNDRPGIVGEISRLLSRKQVNVMDFHTTCESAPMSAGLLFRATARIQLPPELDEQGLQECLEELSDDLMVELISRTD